MAENHFLVEGATCKCQFGSAPDTLVVLTHTKDYINDIEGSKKLIASTKDIGLPFQNKTFGSCTKLRSSCTPNVTDWQDFYKNVTLSNGGKILTEKSKATCAIGGSPCITITDHAQQASITQAHFDNIHPAALTFLNPMLPAANLSIKEPPKIKNIKLTGADTANVVHSKNNTETIVKVLKAAINESLLFEVEAFLNDSKCDKTKTGWRFIKAHSFEGETEEFALSGKNFKVSFDAIGKYRIVAFGSENDAAAIQRCLDVEVVANTITDVEVLDDKNHSRKDNQGTLLLRRGVPVRLNAHYLFSPVSDADRQKVTCRLTDSMGNEITVSDTDTISFTPSNTACTYLLEFTMKAPREGGKDTVIKKTLKSHANGVVKVTCEQGELIRPGTTVVFKAAQLTYSTIIDSDPFELEAIRWYLNGKQVGTGGTLTLNGNEYFTTPAIYVVEANVARPNGYKHNSPGIHEKDDWIFTVALNEITSLEGPTEWIVGKQYNILAAAKMNYEALLDGPVTWLPKVNNNPWSTFNNPQLGANQTNNGNHVNLSPSNNINSLYYETVYATGPGKLSLTAALKGNALPVKLDININYGVVSRWCFLDEKNNYKPKAGWSEKLTVLITCKEAAGSTIIIHLLEYDSPNDSNFIKDLGRVTFDDNGDAKIIFNTNDIKAELQKLWFEGEDYELYFGILKQSEGLQFADMLTRTIKQKEYYFPKNESKKTGKETGDYICINGKKEIVSVKFYDSTGYPAYRVYNYSEKISLLIQTKNMGGDMLEFHFVENKNHEADIEFEKRLFNVDPNEIVDLDLDIKDLKSNNIQVNAGLRSFYIILKNSKTQDFLFPPNIADANAFNKNNVSFYHHLKLSNKSLDLNAGLKTIAPVVLGEALESEEHDSSGCPRCKTDITLAQIEEIFGKSSGDISFRNEILAYLNKYKNDFGISTCVAKAQFVAQFEAEHKMQKQWLIEVSPLPTPYCNIKNRY